MSNIEIDEDYYNALVQRNAELAQEVTKLQASMQKQAGGYQHDIREQGGIIKRLQAELEATLQHNKTLRERITANGALNEQSLQPGQLLEFTPPAPKVTIFIHPDGTVHIVRVEKV